MSPTILFALLLAAPCTAPEFRQFDFWVGDWDTYDMSDTTKVVARNRLR